MKRYKQIIWCVLFLGMVSHPVFAQMAGNPVGVKGKGAWTISVAGNYMEQQLKSENALSRRLLLKSGWGLTPWLDVHGLVGGVQLEMRTSRAGFVNYKDKYRLAYGLGFNIMLSSPRLPVTFWGGGQAIRFLSEGSFWEYGPIYDREYRMEYDWREFEGYAGVIIPIKVFRVYVAAVGWAVQRLDKKNEYLGYGGSQSWVGEVEGEYGSGIMTGGLLGIEWLLPQNYSISVEVRAFNRDDFQIMVGIGQTGGTGW